PSVFSLSLQPDGKIVVVGPFALLSDQPRTNIGRLVNSQPAVQDLSFDSDRITWLRRGTSPEVWRAWFDIWSGNAAAWLPLSIGMRVPGGWQSTGLSLSSNATV